ncbi:hypothetical protein AJ80_00978 [Polytolypa hystricis UAMH7299]|uniref:Ubiquitin-like domain-containing protein n=1 Tax=Polytolypa hystricis (strain UAMH7299) TaxID=1447883 RepID=A0A2B7Z2B3_POLH7|nr:hypothetical protein AJ80_00978 [Polytolypa hystricis UAMH7299]
METSYLLPPELELLLTIRFSASIPDMPLEIPNPTTATGASLKQLIRTGLPKALSLHRLRLIYAGKALEDSIPLSTALKLGGASSSASPGRSNRTPSPVLDSRDKGKVPLRGPSQQRIYIHCSIGDIILSPADLAAEARLAAIANEEHDVDEGFDTSPFGAGAGATGQPGPSSSRSPAGRQVEGQDESTTTTTPAPRGFDRLLSSGFSVAEVSALRSQFLALQSLTHTPDTMPSGAELRRLEDRWMDEDSGGGLDGAAGGGAGITNNDATGTNGVAAGLNDMLWGCVMGFFWPVGCGLWLIREEGVWSWRKGLAVFVGVVVNLGFGAVRVMN